MTTDPNAFPGRRLYQQARALKRAKRQFLVRRGVTAVPTRPATVLQFPNPQNESEST